MNRTMPDWVRNQVLDGLSKLLVLRLQGAPPADTVQAVAEVWCEALTPHTWAFVKGVDEMRLPMAFKLLIQQVDKWVQPAQLIKLIPPRPELQVAGLLMAKTEPPTPEQRAHAERNLAQIRQHLAKMLDKGSLKPPPPRKAEDLLYEYSLVYDLKTGKKRAQPLSDRRKK